MNTVLSWTPSPYTIIIPARDESERIYHAIQSCKQQTLKPKQIIVIDDCSTDGTERIARAEGVKVLRSSTRLGSKAKAQNYALPYVQTKYVIAIDADTLLEKHVADILVHTMNENKVIGACTWVMTQKQNTLWQKARTVEYNFAFAWFKRVQDWVFKTPLICSGCCNIFKTSTLKWLGGYPTDNLAEDMNLTAIIHEKQIGRIRFVPEAIAYTDDPATFKHMSAQLSRWSSAYFENIRKHLKLLWRTNKRAWSCMFIGLVDSLAGSILYYLIMILIGLYFGWKWTIFSIAIDLFMIGTLAAYGARRFEMSLKMFKWLPQLFILRIINSYYFVKYFIITGILNRSLTTYVKGH